MRTVGIKELKARLSEYLRAVEAGEIIRVTRHDETIAEIRPPQAPVRDGVEERLQQLASAGQLTRAQLPRGDWIWSVDGLGLPAGTAAVLLDDLRAERRAG